jgi:hypothetical protein
MLALIRCFGAKTAITPKRNNRAFQMSAERRRKRLDRSLPLSHCHHEAAAGARPV